MAGPSVSSIVPQQALPQGALQAQNVMTHVQVSIMIGNVQVGSGRIQSLNVDHDFGLQPIHGVSDFMPAELVYTKYDGTITLDTFRIRTQDLVDLGIAALGADILKLPVLRFGLIDRMTNKFFRVYEGVKAGRLSERFEQGAILGENGTFKYTKVTGRM